jgi:hypothetical protein
MWHKPWHSSQDAFQGDHRSPTDPILLFSQGYPSGSPETVPPSNIDPSFLRDIPELHDWMSTENISWWADFAYSPQPPLDLTPALPANLWNVESLQLQEDATSQSCLPATSWPNSVEVSNLRSSGHHIHSDASVVPVQLTSKMLALVLPSEGSDDLFWLCRIRHIHKTTPLTYAVRYYYEDPATRMWKIMSKISGSYGTVPHEAVLVAGFSLTASGHLRQNTKEQLQKVLSRQ